MTNPEPCDIEILEIANDDRSEQFIVPNEIRINGHPVLAPADQPVIVHETSIDSHDAVRVTLTLYARRVTIGHEQRNDGT